jgi:hypothetical protein
MTIPPGAQMKTVLEIIQHHDKVIKIEKFTAQAGSLHYGTSM